MQKIILDVDTGIDDALAILYTIGEERADLIGVTTTYGNIDINQATQNTLDLLQLVGQADIPVFKGASHSLSDKKYTRRKVTSRIHGENGIGNIEIDSSTRKPESQDAIDFLIHSAIKYGKELKLICVGPLTNLACAYEKNPEALLQVDEIVIMGGAITVPGNVTSFAEANIIEDAVAAKTILESNLPLKIVGLDVTMRTILTQKETEKWWKYNTNRSQAIAEMTDYYFKSYKKQLGFEGCALHDPLAVGIALYPELAETLALSLMVDLEEPSRGRTVGDYEKLQDKNPTTKVCIQVNHEQFINRFMQAMEDVLNKTK